ncbi:MAG TPA: GWxTD domain-containing protein [Gemmatimonadaceae bacterium]|nr:GWxTD domain-containing protein [Gemmatimonadaceae bacterium]
MLHRSRLVLRRAVVPLLLAGLIGCGARHGEHDRLSPRRAPHNSARNTSLDPIPVYQRAGLLAAAEPLPFVGSMHYLAGATPDSTLVLLTLSLANHALAFSTEGDSPRAAYTVVADVRAGSANSGPSAGHIEAHEVVRIASLKEAVRTDPSIVFQKFITVAPGVYTLTVSVQDDGSIHNSTQDVRLAVPRLDAGTLSSPIVVYQATPRIDRAAAPRMIANPRATAVFGRDSVVQVYLEGYALPSPARVVVITRTPEGTELWRDTVTMAGHSAPIDTLATARVDIPITQIGVGTFEVEAATISADASAGAPASDTVRAPVFVSFFDDGAIATFDDMLSYLRYFTTPDKLDALRNTTPADRAAAWAAFWAATDPVPSTPEHEGIRSYFARLQMANDRFRDEDEPGWLTDRGKVLIILGEPDQILKSSPMNDRGRIETWLYSQRQLELVFVNRTGTGGRWQLTPSSEMQFESIVQRERTQ